ncbi:hypothetical protein Pmar_PMAR001109 [Perkinsus marinus ATCC 50983]|uniref:Uncharacterized protein n=1 Tax=Perkinsus marinus (strain ATCC 50983 / TXsc) TaxID=423536 RepID=C5KSW2_PERM5|nr:hypothetical protein Pmar_PMAR001109 [Perkinsus marinus ATCC 50983]EER12312.1 hypothetical protein Pmar_PMAR001109 [Perkinsus marinus ATCC 50983]|eukprot:XP_002780517.1 hypothetical protein Pmar_PMAR001109 [Perkinsus marinus ATCC 50983]
MWGNSRIVNFMCRWSPGGDDEGQSRLASIAGYGSSESTRSEAAGRVIGDTKPSRGSGRSWRRTGEDWSGHQNLICVELGEATVAPQTLVPIDADNRSHFEVEAPVSAVTMNAHYTTPLLGAAEYRTETASCSANALDDASVEEKEDKLPIAPPDRAASSQADVVQSRQDNIVEHVELPIAAFSSVDEGPARETADELAKAMTSEGLKAESDAQGLLWNAGDRARAVGAGFCDGGLAQLVALAAPETRKLLGVYQSDETTIEEAINDLTEWLAEGPLDGVLL